MKRVLFVCLGNICRSPTAEGVFRKLVEEAGLNDRFEIASAGTGDWHCGQKPDRRTRAAAKKRGYVLESVARQVDMSDFERFDHIIAMDLSNRAHLLELCPAQHRGKIALLRDWDPQGGEPSVPDPYYGGADGFENVLDIVERSCRSLLDELR